MKDANKHHFTPSKWSKGGKWAPKIEQKEISLTVSSVKQVQNQWGFSIFPVSHHFGSMLSVKQVKYATEDLSLWLQINLDKLWFIHFSSRDQWGEKSYYRWCPRECEPHLPANLGPILDLLCKFPATPLARDIQAKSECTTCSSNNKI